MGRVWPEVGARRPRCRAVGDGPGRGVRRVSRATDRRPPVRGEIAWHRVPHSRTNFWQCLAERILLTQSPPPPEMEGL
jgi:hypothetical protein